MTLIWMKICRTAFYRMMLLSLSHKKKALNKMPLIIMNLIAMTLGGMTLSRMTIKRMKLKESD